MIWNLEINCNANSIGKRRKRAWLTLLSNSKMLVVQETEYLHTDFQRQHLHFWGFGNLLNLDNSCNNNNSHTFCFNGWFFLGHCSAIIHIILCQQPLYSIVHYNIIITSCSRAGWYMLVLGTRSIYHPFIRSHSYQLIMA